MAVDRPSADGRRTVMNVVAAVLGNALEFYDFVVYALFATMIGQKFFPTGSANSSLLLSVATFGVGFFARPLGGIVIGAYADRYGRRPAMTLTILMMAVGSGMIGILPGYAEIGVAAPVLLVLARLIQGFSTGGEMGPATAFLLETAPLGRRWFYGSWQLASQNIGGIISGLLGVGLALVLSPASLGDWGWRVPFLFGIVIAPVGLYLRRNIEETLPAEDAHESMAGVLGEVLREHWGKLVQAILVVSGATLTQYFFLYTTTYALTTLHFAQQWSMGAQLTVGIFGTLGALAGGVLADRHGLKPLAVLPRILVALLLYPALMLVVSTGSPVLYLVEIAVLMSIHAAAGGAAITVMAALFPARTRTAGLAISYAVGVTLFGGTAQLIFTWVINVTGDKLSWVWYIVAIDLLCALATGLVRLPDQVTAFGHRSAPPALASAGR